MKQIILIFISILLIACSSDDAPAPVEPQMWYGVKIKFECPTTFPATSYCITKEVYNEIRAEKQNNLNVSCLLISFTDIDGVPREGYYTSATKYTYNPCAE